MTSPSGLAVAGRVLAIVVTGAAAALSLLLVFLLLSSLLGDSGTDPHGYVLIFGSLLLVPTSLVGAASLPFVIQREDLTARRVAIGCAVAWVVGAFVLAGVALSG